MSMDAAQTSKEDLIAELESVRQERDELAVRVGVIERQLQQLKVALTGREDNFHELEGFGPDNNLVDRLDQLEARYDDADPEPDAPPIVHYANIPRDERADLLSTSEHVAVELHTNWEDIAWKLGDPSNRRVGVDSKTKANAKYNPSRLKHRLKQLLDREFESIEVYRGLRRLAKLSGGEEGTDGNGRVHITGGKYEYHHRPTIDGRDTKHVLFQESE